MIHCTVLHRGAAHLFLALLEGVTLPPAGFSERVKPFGFSKTIVLGYNLLRAKMGRRSFYVQYDTSSIASVGHF